MGVPVVPLKDAGLPLAEARHRARYLSHSAKLCWNIFGKFPQLPGGRRVDSRTLCLAQGSVVATHMIKATMSSFWGCTGHFSTLEPQFPHL